MPAVLTVSMQQKFFVALGAGNGALHDIRPEPLLLHEAPDLIACHLVQMRLAHDSSPAHLIAANFELRLYQNRKRGAAGPKHADHGGEDHRGGDEAHVANAEI